MSIHRDFNPEIISNIIKQQIPIKRQFDKEVAETGSSNLDMRNFVVLDDCLRDTEEMVGTQIRTSCFITVPYAMSIPVALRENIDYVFIFREPIVGNRERIWSQYASKIMDFDSFCKAMDQCTEN